MSAKQERDGALAPDPVLFNADILERRWRSHVRACIEAVLPILTFVSFSIIAEGSYDMTPDHQPVVCAVGEEAGLWVAAGFSGHGFMIAPAVARLVADAVLDNRRDELLDVLDVRRFAEGRAVPEPQLV